MATEGRHAALLGWTRNPSYAVGLASCLTADSARSFIVGTYGTGQAIIGQRCVSCHADKPTQESFAAAPKDVKLDAPERITANEQRIYEQVVATKAMPIGNLTGMTDAERATIAAWVAGGARSR